MWVQSPQALATIMSGMSYTTCEENVENRLRMQEDLQGGNKDCHVGPRVSGLYQCWYFMWLGSFVEFLCFFFLQSRKRLLMPFGWGNESC